MRPDDWNHREVVVILICAIVGLVAVLLINGYFGHAEVFHG